MKRHRIHVWRGPAALAAVSAFGLVAALVDDGAADVVGCLALAVPLGVCVWGCVRFLRRDPPRA